MCEAGKRRLLKFGREALHVRVAGGEEEAEPVFSQVGGRSPRLHRLAVARRPGVAAGAHDARAKNPALHVEAAEGVGREAEHRRAGTVRRERPRHERDFAQRGGAADDRTRHGAIGRRHAARQGELQARGAFVPQEPRLAVDGVASGEEPEGQLQPGAFARKSHPQRGAQGAALDRFGAFDAPCDRRDAFVVLARSVRAPGAGGVAEELRLQPRAPQPRLSVAQNADAGGADARGDGEESIGNLTQNRGGAEFFDRIVGMIRIYRIWNCDL